MGLGQFGGGLGAVRYLCRQGARVTVTDSKPAEELTESLEALAEYEIERYCLGGHTEQAFQDAELVVVNPAVKPDHPCLDWCRNNEDQAVERNRAVLPVEPGANDRRHRQQRKVDNRDADPRNACKPPVSDLIWAVTSAGACWTSWTTSGRMTGSCWN